MWNSYFSYLDYLQIRRRIERRLSRSRWLFIHTAVFVITPLVVYFTSPWLWWYPGYPYVIQPSIGGLMWGWAVALMLHGLWTYFRSGAWDNTRNLAIETEMRERVQNKDSYLVQDARDLFRLRGLLDDDVRRRASATITPLALFSVVNGVLWIVARGGTYNGTAWDITPMLGLLLLPILAFNFWQVRLHERKLRDLLAAADPAYTTKPKHDVLHLADDGEVLDIMDENDDYEKPKRATYSE
jgi:hypothetical protein